MPIRCLAPAMLLILTATAPVRLVGPPPPPAALIDRFMAALPPGDRLQQIASGPDAATQTRLTALNPGRGAEIHAILATYELCLTSAANAFTDALLRRVAGELGEQRLVRMIAFYEGPHVARADQLFGRVAAGESLTAGEQVEANDLMQRYPLQDFAEALDRSKGQARRSSELARRITRCETDRAAALVRADVRDPD